MFSRFFHLGVVILLLTVAGCSTDKQTAELIKRAESIAVDKPDSAIKIMRSIDSRSLRSKHDLAYYRLVYSEALYYNYTEGENDSLTQLMADYYISSDNHAERARAMFQHAMVKKNRGEFDEAMYYFLEAENSLAAHADNRLKGLVHREKGQLYGAEYLFNNALNEHLMAKESFEKAGSEYYVAYSDYNIGLTYLCLQQFDNSEQYLRKALDYAQDNNMGMFISEIIFCLLDAHCSQGNYKELSELFEQYEQYLRSTPLTFYRYRAIHNAYCGDSQMAISDLEEAKKAGCEEIHWEYTAYIVYAILGDNDLALRYLEKCVGRQNNQIIVSLDAPILNMQVELGIREKLELQMRSKYEKLILMLIVIIVIIFITTFTHTKLIRKKAEIELLKDKVESILDDLETQASRVKSLTALAGEKERMVSTMRRDIAKHLSRELERISNLLDAYYSDVTKSVKHNQVIAELDKYVKDFADSREGYQAVEHLVNECLDNIMDKLRSQVQSFKEEDYRLLCLIYADFSSNAICMFMGYDKNKLYKHKSKLKSMLVSSKAEDKALFIKHLR